MAGQDGSCLAGFLPGKGCEVHGAMCRASLFSAARI